MGDDITIGVTEIVNNIEVTAQPNDQIVDISVIDNADDVTLNITPTVIEININKGSSYAKWGTILGTLSDQTDLQNALDLKANLVGGKVPASELPSYVDDVVEVADYAALPATGETGKIYVTLDNNKIYRWSGSVYIEIAANSAIWGAITGTLSNQTDLQNALNAKFDDPTGDTTQYIAGDGSLITFPIAGQSGTLVREVRNTTGSTLTKGTIVYINGANGNKPTIAKALATGDSTSAQTFGMLQADIANNANGYVVCVGDIIGLDTSAITEGTQLYLSSTTAGAYTSTKQVAPAHLVYIGVVTRSHPTLGQIEVKIQNGYELDEIHDVSITSKTNKDFLVYESATSLWKNKSLSTILGGTSSQFVKGDGSLDSNVYALDSAVVHLTGNETISGTKTFSSILKSGLLFINETGGFGNITGFTQLGGTADYFQVINGANTKSTKFIHNGGRSLTMPATDGTLALTSQLHDALTIGTANGLSLSGQALSLALASTSTTGALSSTDWNKFNNNIPSGTPNVGDYVIYNGSNLSYRTVLTTSPLSFNVSTGTFAISQATTSANGYLSSTDWNTFNGKQNALTNPITGTGTTNYLPKFTGSTALGNSQIFDDGSFVGIGVASGLNRTLQIVGTQISQKEAFSPNEFLIGQFDSAGNAAINNVANANLYFHTNNQRAMTILANLNVGLGVNTPTEKLHVNGNLKLSASSSFLYGGDNAGRLIVTNNDVTTYFGIYGSAHPTAPNVFSIVANNIAALTIPNNGRVGIGTTSPSEKLEVVGGGFAAGNGTIKTGITYSSLGLIGTFTNHDFGLLSNGTEKMRITSGGDVLVNSTSNTLGGKLASTLNDNGYAISVLKQGTFGAAILARVDNTNSDFCRFWYSSSNTQVGSINTNGTTTSYNVTSDYRLKQDFKPFNGLNLVSKIKVYDYEWKVDKSRMNGVIAHELQEVIPYAVTGEKDGDAMQQVDYSKLVPILVQAIQELQEKINKLENK